MKPGQRSRGLLCLDLAARFAVEANARRAFDHARQILVVISVKFGAWLPGL
jgi:hypothetical protein